MTNTTVPRTATGITCSKCSREARREIKHANIPAVKLCCGIGVAPVLTLVPEPVAVPKTQTFARYLAACRVKGCPTSDVRDVPFTIWCTNHGRAKRIRAKQLVGTYSDSPRRRCDPRCTGAVGPECVCQCGGANHGADHLVSR